MMGHDVITFAVGISDYLQYQLVKFHDFVATVKYNALLDKIYKR